MLPERGKWRLKTPLWGDAPPFPILEMDFVSRRGSAGLNMQCYELRQVLVRPGAGVFLASYKVGSHHGMLEGKYQADKSLQVVFSGGTVETTVDTYAIDSVGSIDGAPDAPEPKERAGADASQYEIHCAGDIARWFDGLVMENEHELKRMCDKFAKNNPDSWIAVTAANTASDLYSVVAHQGQGLVDTLRLGEGCCEGGWGIGKDMLRALNFVPLFENVRPLANRITALRGGGAAAREAVSAAEEANTVRATAAAPVRAASLPPKAAITKLPGPVARDPGHSICWAVAGVNAMQIFKAKTWISAGRLLEKVKGFGLWAVDLVPAESLGAHLREMKEVLRKYGVNLCQLAGFKFGAKAEEILDLTRKTPVGSVVIFTVKWVARKGAQAGQEVAHSLVAWHSKDGVYLVDRTAEETGRLLRSLEDLEGLYMDSGYTGIAGGQLTEVFQLERCLGGFLRQGSKLVFAIGLTTALAVQGLEAKNTDGTPAH